MSLSEVANGLVNLCRQGKFMDVLAAYYSDDIVSIEPVGSLDMPAQQSGIEAIRGKNQWWVENHEVHGLNVKGPYIGEGGFAAYFEFDVTPKMTGQRMNMKEMALYTVEDGKIVREEFYYNMPGS